METSSIAIIIIVAALIMAVIYAMRHGHIGSFTFSKGEVSIVARHNSDAMFLKTIATAIDGIDNLCRLHCWRYVLENRPPFLHPEHQLPAILSLLEMVCFNHVLRGIEISGFKEYCNVKQQAALIKSAEFKIPKAQMDKYVTSVLTQCAHFARDAATKKINLYESHAKRTDLSPACISVLNDKIAKNKKYLTLSIG